MATMKTKYYDATGKSYDGYNIDGKTYKDETGTQRIDKDSYVQTGDKWYKMGDTGGVETSIPEFAGGWISNESKPKEETKSTNSTPKFNNSSYENGLSDLQNLLANYNSNINQIEMPKFDTSKIEKTQGDLSALLSALQTYQNANSMSRDESNARAYSELNNQYNAGLDKTLNAYNKDAVSRGMFGQLPVEALKANAMSESELNKASAISDLASNLYTNDFNMARQKDADYYNKINQQSNLLGTLYNTQSDQYNNSINEYLNSVNLASLKDNNYYNNISNQSNLINQGYGLMQDQYNADLNQYTNNKQETINTMGAYSNDYQARINELKNDGDNSNDWQIPYLNSLRNDKVSNQQQAMSQAEANNQKQLQDLALTMFKELGYAEPWMADILGIEPGQYTQSYADMLADNARKSNSGSSSATDNKETEKEWTPKDSANLFKDASDLAKTLATLNKSNSDTGEFGSLAESAGVDPDKKEYTEADIQKLYYYLYELYNTDPADAMLLDELQKSQNLSEPKYYSSPTMDLLRNYLN